METKNWQQACRIGDLEDRIAELELNNMYLATKKRKTEVNSPSRLEKKKLEVKYSQVLSQQIDNMLKNHKR
jgi:hypothetical protein